MRPLPPPRDNTADHAAAYEEIELRVCNERLTVKGRRYGASPSDPSKRVLAWPGWLDNCGSFSTLAPFFVKQGFTFVAMDPPGCGLSDHIPTACWYNDYEESLVQMEIAEKLGWVEPFILMAHSRGSNVSAVTAGAFPDRIRGLILFESYLGTHGCFLRNYTEMGGMYKTFAASIEDDRKNRLRKRKNFASLEQVVQDSMQNKMFPKNKQSATEISSRHIIPCGNEFTSTWDLRFYNQVQTNSVSPYVALKFVQSITCPVLVINSRKTSLYYVSVDDFENWYKAYLRRAGLSQDAVKRHQMRRLWHDICMRYKAVKDITVKNVNGDHHFHSDMAKITAILCLDFLLERCSSSAPTMMSSVISPPSFSKLVSSTGMPKRRDTVSALSGGYAELVLEVTDTKVAVKIWGNRSGRERIIAWCDAQDNSGSFDVLAETFTKMSSEVCLVAVDPPGRGHSSHFPSTGFCGVGEEVVMLHGVADMLGWMHIGSTFSIFAHGTKAAAVALIAAAGYSRNVKALVLIDSHRSPLSTPAEKIVQSMRKTYDERKALLAEVNEWNESKEFDSFEDILDFLERTAEFRRSDKALFHIGNRASEQLSNGKWKLRDDVGMHVLKQTPMPINFDRITTEIERVDSPVLSIIATRHDVEARRITERPVSHMEEMGYLCRQTHSVMRVGTTHYPHVDSPLRTAEAIIKWMTTLNILQEIEVQQRQKAKL